MEGHSSLTLYKASAGSGKTFMLAVRYIAILARNPQAYRNILAVTFTNKATAEMKQRIMSQLYGITHNLSESDAYFETVRKLVPQQYSDAQIRQNAGKALTLILQDYGHFRVETIDSFFQSVLRGLARELQLGSNLSLELDQEGVISNAVDAFLANLEPKSKEDKYVLDFVQDNIDDDKGWHIDHQLKEFSKQLFSEVFMEKGTRLRDALENPDAIQSYAKSLREKRGKLVPELIEKTKRCGENISRQLEQRGYPVSALGKNQCNLVQSILDGTFLEKETGKTIGNIISGDTTLFKKPDIKKDPSLEAFTSDIAIPMFNEAKTLHEQYERCVNSYDAALRHLNELALLLAVRSEINRQNQEEGRFVLADTAHLLSSLTENDTSFVFEKTGSFVRHLMIDEFQDTSSMQWKNLQLLILECLSQNQDCLVVGDVKQSIYRWRNGDWNILNSEIEQRFRDYNPETVPLKTNRRSHGNIIDFNNSIFPKAKSILMDSYESLFNDKHTALEKAYSDVRQESPRKTKDGYVRVSMLRKGEPGLDKDELTMQMIETEIDRLINAGVSYEDITLLLRNKKDITTIANYFATARPDLPMISGEAFQLDSSYAVRIIVNAMRWISEETDQVALASLLYERSREILGEDADLHTLMGGDLGAILPDNMAANRERLRNIPLYELSEYLNRTLLCGKAGSQDAYILTFLDLVREFAVRTSADISDFIDAWDDKLHKKAIPSGNIASIRLMTIHASKGLEFHTVIIPCCDWTICMSGDQMWCEPQEEPFNEMPLLPIEYSKSLGNSAFSEEYRQETSRQMVDSLNLLYVAATRPVCNMVILSATPAGKDADAITRISDVISKCLKDEYEIQPDENGFLQYENGEILPHSGDRPGSNVNNPLDTIPESCDIAMESYGITASFRQSGESQRFTHSSGDDAAEPKGTQESYIENGKLLHQLLSVIRTPADIRREVSNLLSQGLIESSAKAGSIISLISKAISAPEVERWFDPHWTLFNETSVLFRHNGKVQTRRPDRVMTDGNETIVVDFKFAREREEHLHQVQEYVELLGKMGFTNIKGYVWYIYQNKIISC